MFTMPIVLLHVRRAPAFVLFSLICASTLAGAESMDTIVDSLFKLRQLSEASISPDGKQAAWVQTREDPSTGAVSLSVYMVNLEKPGAAAKRITAGNGTAEYTERQIAWSGDSRRLSFLSDAEKKGQAQLYIADVSGGRTQKLTNVTGALANPSWSPDGKT